MVINTNFRIDNRKLNNFLEYFVNNKCDFDCQSCGYCERVAKEVVELDPDIKNVMRNYEGFFNDLISGNIYTYLKRG